MKTFTSFLKIIAIVAVIGVGIFAPAKVYAQQSVANTIWAKEMMDDTSQNIRTLQGIVSFEAFEFGASTFAYYQIFWGLTNQARNTLSRLGFSNNVASKQREGTYTQSGNTIDLTYSNGDTRTFTINADGSLTLSNGATYTTKVQSLNIVEWPDSLKN